MLLGNSLGLTRSAKSTRSPESTLRSPSSIHRTAQSLNWGNEPAGRYGNLEILGRAGNYLCWQIRDVDSARLILVALGNDLKEISWHELVQQ